MRFLVVDTDYPEFLHWFYLQHPGLEGRRYEEQVQARTESLFSIASFYSRRLDKLGQEAWDVYANNESMQLAWAREHGIRVRRESRLNVGLRRAVPWANRILGEIPSNSAWHTRLERAPARAGSIARHRWSNRVLADILTAQIKRFTPDVLLNLAMDWIGTGLLKKIKPYVRMLVGQIAAPVPQGEDFRCYDLVISSLPNLVEHFRKLRIPSELIRLAFEPTVVSRLNGRVPKIAVSFVGSLSRHHTRRIRWLEQLCRRPDLQIWGPGVDSLPTSSPIRDHHRGSAWGLEMYRILQSSKVTLNQHIDVAGSYANNLRLFEATGVGTLLITDWKENLHEMFEPDKEVVAYRTAEECASLVDYYLENEHERDAVAHAGQQRTLRDHTYENRARELIELVERYL